VPSAAPASAVPWPPPDAVRPPARVEPVPGTGYGLAIYPAPPATSGQAIGALVAGIASILVSLVVGCFGFAGVAAAAEGQYGGWGPLVGGAFTVLATFFGLAGVGLGVAGLRQIRAAGPRTDRIGGRPVGGQQVGGQRIGGRGMAIAGIACGASGVAIALCSLGFAILAVLA
jgi:hypothetical protein